MQPIAPKSSKKDNPHDWDQFMDMSEFLFNPVSKSVAAIEFLGSFIFNVLRMACVPAEVLFRRNFGERHFNLYLYIGGTLWLAIFATGWLNLSATMGIEGLGLVSNTVIFAAVALVFYGRMFWLLFLVKSGEIDVRKYSYYDGDPLPLLYHLPFAKDSQGNPQEYRIRQLHEPVIMLLLGLVFSVVLNPQTGTWLILSAGCMALKEYVKARHLRNLILDQINADIIARNMAEAIKGEPAKQTQGIYLAGVSNEGRDREILQNLAEKNAENNQARFTTAPAA